MREPVLITDDCFYGVLAAARALCRGGHPTWVTGVGPGSYAARSRYVAGRLSVPAVEHDREGFVQAIAEGAARHGFAAVLPAEEPTLMALAGRQNDMPTQTRLGVPAPELVERVLTKPKVLAMAQDAGLTTPSTVTVPAREVAAAAGRLGYPVVVKTARSKVRMPDGRLERVYARLVKSEGALVDFVASSGVSGEWIVQPYVPGRLYAVAGVAWEGEVLGTVHQVAHRIGPTNMGSSAFAETVAADVELNRGVTALIGALGWSGIFQAQFMRCARGDLLIDLNPRIYGSLALAVAAGADLPGLWLELLLGRRPAWPGYRVGARYRSEEKDAGVILHALRTRSPIPSPRTAVPCRGTVHAVFSWRDPAPLITTARKVLLKVRGAGGTP